MRIVSEDDVIRVATARLEECLRAIPNALAWNRWVDGEVNDLAHRLRSVDAIASILSYPEGARELVVRGVADAWAEVAKRKVLARLENGDADNLPHGAEFWSTTVSRFLKLSDESFRVADRLLRDGRPATAEEVAAQAEMLHALAEFRAEAEGLLKKGRRGPRESPDSILAIACDDALVDRSHPERARVAEELAAQILGETGSATFLLERTKKNKRRRRRPVS